MNVRRMTLALGVLATAGLAIAAYLTYVHYAGIDPVCSGGGCEQVQSSAYAELRGVPVALLGLIGYALILVALGVPGEAGRTLTVILAFAGLGYSAYLTYLELFEIRAICLWCVASAAVMTAVAALAAARLLRGDGSTSIPTTRSGARTG